MIAHGGVGRLACKKEALYIPRTFTNYRTGGAMALKTSTLENGIALVEPSGSLVGGDETVDLRAAVAGFVDRNYDKLLIDLSKVNYMNSTAIGVLVSAQTTYSKKGWQVKLCGINKNISNIFVITKLTLVFEVFDKREEALASFK